MKTVAVDTSALIAYADRDPDTLALFVTYAQHDTLLVAPAPIFAESLRGIPRDAPIYRALRVLEPIATTAQAARHAGELLGAADADATLTVDALIIATAIAHGASAIITCDVRDHRRLAPDGFAVIAVP